jgi:hypothetical protein
VTKNYLTPLIVMAFTIPQPVAALTQTSPAPRASKVQHFDVTWNRPIFRAPSLPLTSQMWSEIPFTAQFPARTFNGRGKA